MKPMKTKIENVRLVKDSTYEAFIPANSEGTVASYETKKGLVRWYASIVIGYNVIYEGEIKRQDGMVLFLDSPVSRKKVYEKKLGFKEQEEAKQWLDSVKIRHGIGAEYKPDCFAFINENYCEALTEFYSPIGKCKGCTFYRNDIDFEIARIKQTARKINESRG